MNLGKKGCLYVGEIELDSEELWGMIDSLLPSGLAGQVKAFLKSQQAVTALHTYTCPAEAAQWESGQREGGAGLGSTAKLLWDRVSVHEELESVLLGSYISDVAVMEVYFRDYLGERNGLLVLLGMGTDPGGMVSTVVLDSRLETNRQAQGTLWKPLVLTLLHEEDESDEAKSEEASSEKLTAQSGAANLESRKLH